MNYQNYLRVEGYYAKLYLGSHGNCFEIYVLLGAKAEIFIITSALCLLFSRVKYLTICNY